MASWWIFKWDLGIGKHLELSHYKKLFYWYLLKKKKLKGEKYISNGWPRHTISLKQLRKTSLWLLVNHIVG